jgi:hemin uptake protein HemP
MSRKKHRDEDTWAPIQESLDDFQPAPLAARLREYLAPRVPPGTRRLEESTRRALFEGVDALLAEHAGAWYTQAGARLGNESLGGYDPRSLFPGPGGAPDMGVESNIEHILSALGVAHAWLCTLDTYFRSLALPEDAADRVTVLSDAVRRVIALTAEATGGRGRWYDCVHRSLDWLLESLDIRRTERVERALGEALEDLTSGSLPSEAQTRQAASIIARAVVRDDFPRRYPEEDVS